LGTFEELSAQDERVVERHTPARDVGSDSLRAVLAGFDSALSAPMAPLWTFVPTQPQSTGPELASAGYTTFRSFARQAAELLFRHRLHVMLVVNANIYPAVPSSALVATGAPVSSASSATLPGAEDVVSTVRSIEGRLGLSARQVCDVTGISKSAFYTWARPGGPRPRLASQRRLWALAQLAEDLEDLLEAPPAGWLLANPVARTMLTEGRFDDVTDLVRAQIRGSSGRAAPEYARLLAVGADRLDSDSESPLAPSRPRRVSQAQSVKSGRRKK
jgi:hypothetical protein